MLPKTLQLTYQRLRECDDNEMTQLQITARDELESISGLLDVITQRNPDKLLVERFREKFREPRQITGRSPGNCAMCGKPL